MGTKSLPGQRHPCGVPWVNSALWCGGSPVRNPGGTPIFWPLPFRGDRLETKKGARELGLKHLVVIFLMEGAIDHFRITAIWPGDRIRRPEHPTENEVRCCSCDESVQYFNGTNFALITKILHTYLPFYIWSWYIYEMKVHIHFFIIIVTDRTLPSLLT